MFAVYSLISFFYFNVKYEGVRGYFIIGGAFFLTLFGLWCLRTQIQKFVHKICECSHGLSSRNWFILCFCLGGVFRVGLYVFFPTELYSDEAHYMALVTGLVEKGEYEINGLKSFFPPGLPFFYYPFLKIFGPNPWFSLAHNLCLFFFSLIVIRKLTVLVVGAGPERFAMLLFAVWPNLALTALIPAKELLVSFFLALTVLVFLYSENNSTGFRIICGFCLGFLALIQPSTALIFGVLFLYSIMKHKKNIHVTLTSSAVIVFSMGIVILPWTFRNYVVHETFVPISTNGGVVFLSANNPHASGGWIDMDYSPYLKDEIIGNKMAYQEGLAWIKSNPGKFLKLIPKKQIRFLGDDGYGAFRVFGHPAVSMKYSREMYETFIFISNGFWLILICLIFNGWILSWNTPFLMNPVWIIILGVVWYFLIIHGIFQSEGKHHINISIFLVIMASILGFNSLKHPHTR